MGVPSPRAVAAGGDQRRAGRPRWEVADVVRAYGAEYRRTYPTSSEQRRVLRAIAACRTAALGGHIEQCADCAYRRIAYHSCRNRHCPKCQGQQGAQWMAAEQAMLLPVPYFHVVFTVPHALNPLIRVNRRVLLGLLFRSAARTLHAFAHAPCHLGAEPAITMVLHTWGQTLTEHYHVHCVVSGGGLSLDRRTWVALPKGKKKRRPFLFPVHALSQVFRGKFIATLTRCRQRATLRYVGQSAALAEPARWAHLIDTLWATNWAVYSKRPFGGPEQVLKYLSRYTHRVAISNQRLLAVGAGTVCFEYHDYAAHSQRKELSLPAVEFLRRFLQHIVPRGFMRIRHYGLTANRQRTVKLARARALLGQSPPAPAPESTDPDPPRGDVDEPDAPGSRCPACGGVLRVLEILVPTPVRYDTS